MPSFVRSKDFLAGILFLVLGAGFAIVAQDYDMGTARSMGPGYLPTAVGVLLAVLGIGLAIAGAITSSPAAALSGFSLRGMIFIVLSAVAFAVFVRGLGLFLTVLIVSVLATMASRKANIVRGVVIGLVLATCCSVLFVWILNLTIPVWGPWLPF